MFDDLEIKSLQKEVDNLISQIKSIKDYQMYKGLVFSIVFVLLKLGGSINLDWIYLFVGAFLIS
jgi:hypothetical protein